MIRWLWESISGQRGIVCWLLAMWPLLIAVEVVFVVGIVIYAATK